MSQAKQPDIHHSAIRGQVEKILAHGLFTRSERMGRFLRVAVERSLEGRAADLKEYLVGVEVFDRKETYDPRVDPIVRVEAPRLPPSSRHITKAMAAAIRWSSNLCRAVMRRGFASPLRVKRPMPGPLAAPNRAWLRWRCCRSPI
jgi:hypothetical protein